MTRFVLVRHAAHDWLGRGVAGRRPGVGLNAEGRSQAQELVRGLAALPLTAICSSPQQRACETAEPLAASRGLAVVVEAAFDEIDFGDWTGRSFEELRATGAPWEQWVHRRGSAQPPAGEPFAGVAERAMAGLQVLRQAHPDGQVLVVSHGDVIKAAVAACLGMSLNGLERFEVAPASCSVLDLGDGWMQLKLLNAQGDLLLKS